MMLTDGGWVKRCLDALVCSCGSVVEHCVSSAKGRGFNSQGIHMLRKKNV